MGFHGYPLQQLVVISSSTLSNLVATFSILTRLFSIVLTCCFALVGILLGVMTGAFHGQETESGFVRGAAVGAISGAVFSLEVFESFMLHWRSDESTFGCLLYLIDVMISLVTGRLVRERIGPAILNAVQSQLGAMESSYDDFANIFDIGGTKALSWDLLEKIPIVKITKDDTLDSSGDQISCSVCLQDFEKGETVRCLPDCHHMFHLACIDKWLMRHASCPLCRRNL